MGGPGERPRLHLYAKPVDVSAELREKLFAAYPTVVATSATLATDGNIGYWRGRVGLDQADELVLDSPFDFRRNALIYLPAAFRPFDPCSSAGRARHSTLIAWPTRSRRWCKLAAGGPLYCSPALAP